jgi:pyruvate-ferredoxin/flavodoxin oxidoreductase
VLVDLRGNLPTTPWSKDANGRGPAWSNSLFEDNAEFGLGLRLGVEQQTTSARTLLCDLAPEVGEELAGRILASDQSTEAGVAAQRQAVDELRAVLGGIDGAVARRLEGLVDYLVEKVVWIVGGDGWAYDIGFGGLDHVLASGANVNILVLDTEVYSNTGGQASKATPRGAVARFAAAGKALPKKELGLFAAGYGSVYVAQIALGANEIQAVKALAEAASYPGPSIVIAYAHCTEHGLEMATGMRHQHNAVAAGYWPLWRFDPRAAERGERPFRLDCRKPTLGVATFYGEEDRFATLARSHPDEAARLAELAAKDVAARWTRLEALAGAHDGPAEG